MMKYAAYDDLAIYALGDTPAQAVKNARDAGKEPTARFLVAPVTDEFARWIDEHGWDGAHRTFDLVHGFLIDTTGKETTMKRVRLLEKENKVELAARELFGDALEIAKDDPEIRPADFESFCNIMWPDDHDMNRRGFTRDEYRQALRYAWELLQTKPKVVGR